MPLCASITTRAPTRRAYADTTNTGIVGGAMTTTAGGLYLSSTQTVATSAQIYLMGVGCLATLVL
jgi:hypothetical protein